MNYFAIVKVVFNVIIVIFFRFEYIEINTWIQILSTPL
jgi:hypothetical protein